MITTTLLLLIFLGSFLRLFLARCSLLITLLIAILLTSLLTILIAMIATRLLLSSILLIVTLFVLLNNMIIIEELAELELQVEGLGLRVRGVRFWGFVWRWCGGLSSTLQAPQPETLPVQPLRYHLPTHSTS